MSYEPIVSLLVEIDRKLGAILAALSPAEAVTEDATPDGVPRVAMTAQGARAIAHSFAQLAEAYAEAGMAREAATATEQSHSWLVAAEVEAADGQ